MKTELTRRQFLEGVIEAGKKLPVVLTLASCVRTDVRPSPQPTRTESKEQHSTLLNLLAGSIYFGIPKEYGYSSQASFIKEDGKYYLLTHRSTASSLKNIVRDGYLAITVVPITTNGIQFEIDPDKFIYEKDDALYSMDPLRPSIDDAIKTDRFTYLVRSMSRLSTGDKVALPRPGDNSGRSYTLQLHGITDNGEYFFDFSFGADCNFPAGAPILKMVNGVVTKEIMGLSSGANVFALPGTAKEAPVCKGQILFKPIR